MRPLSLVPMRTPAPRGEAATEKAVTVVELQSTSELPSGEMRKTALRAFCRSLRLRVCACGCVPSVVVVAPLSSTVVTVPVTVPPPEVVLTVCVVCGVAAGFGLGSAALKASAEMEQAGADAGG